METLKENVLNKIQADRGIAWFDLHAALEGKKGSVDDVLNELIKEGLVTKYGEGYYPILRHINVYSKESEKLVGEVELTDLTASELASVMQPYQDDPLYFYCYELKKNQAEFFNKRYGVVFKFDMYDYFLEASFDNRKQK